MGWAAIEEEATGRGIQIHSPQSGWRYWRERCSRSSVPLGILQWMKQSTIRKIRVRNIPTSG